MIDVGMLGVGGTLPMPGRPLSSALIRCGGEMILMDCGEGTQVGLRKLGWGIKDIGTILISHFHADHVGGIPGLLLTIGNSGRTKSEPLTIAGPRGIGRIVDGLRVIAPHLPYPVKYREMTGKPDDVIPVGPLRVTSAWAEHEIPCLAYRFDLPRARPFLPENAKKLGLPVEFWKRLQRGETVTFDGKNYLPEDVLGPPRPGLSVGFVTDTRPTQQLVEFVTDVNLLICEAMYGDPEDLPKALENKHMVFAESAMIGAAARAGQLWLTHFSPALPFPEQYRAEAERIYPGVVLGREMLSTSITFPD
ncbi:ribonuclease Z [Zavarzinella formosa]|uniref:ribonuclease Z n=1 Tax=Zavarzinella formosa TaxID=360055 RepID=UPI0004956CD6|nr:ribonuclease Z [Zavarzinella formosa]